MATKKQDNSREFSFGKENYILMLTAIGMIILGFALMTGGGSKDPNVFTGEQLFSFRRITLAPIIVILGYVVGVVSIVYKSKE